MEQKKLKWKDVYKDNKYRKYCEISGIQKEDIELESNSYKVFKKRKYIIGIASLLFVLLMAWVFRKDYRLLLMILVVFAVMGVGFFVFSYYKFKCMKDGLYIKFGLQQGKFPYERLKSVYLSRYSDFGILSLSSIKYSFVIRYEDNLNRLRELSFPNYFITPEEAVKFLNNFNVNESQDEKYVRYERFKIAKKVLKTILIILFAAFLIGVFVTNGSLKL